MSEQQINQLENRIFKLEQELKASAFRGDIAYRLISFLSLISKTDASFQKYLVENIESLSIKPDASQMEKTLFEAEKKHAISQILSVNREKDK
ncbi:hypothetical protein EF68_001205 [Salmonella enterica subsp. enterica]|nr:hypothetical protein [Salmonella enterica subsp. salamae]EDT2969347.1 hypothetical protein [Salmonella enterica subsp. enterica serovar Fischerstrasse]EDW4023199.1 hypothetical protein [Salmonella enterica subsp. salamae]